MAGVQLDRYPDPTIPEALLFEFRCLNERCHKLLAKVKLAPGAMLQVKCPGCKQLSTVRML